MTLIFVRDSVKDIDEGMAVMVYSYNNQLAPEFNYMEALKTRIKTHLTIFNGNDTFMYYSYLVYLILFHHSQNFKDLGIYRKLKIILQIENMIGILGSNMENKKG